ncbi:hypothetical protein N9L68_08435, partial [bacterium]|nr:hypothetical protein [bacterium]
VHQEGIYARRIGFMLVPNRCDLVRVLVGQDKSYVMLARARRRILARARARALARAWSRLRARVCAYGRGRLQGHDIAGAK